MLKKKKKITVNGSLVINDAKCLYCELDPIVG